MITIHKRRFLRKPLIITHDNWTQCSQEELIILFRILQSRWYSDDSRTLVREFLSEPDSSQTFTISKLGKFIGPDKQLRSMSIGQWSFIERKVFDLSQEYSKENIGKLLACIYTDGKQFVPESIDARAKMLQNTPKEVIDATIFCWTAIRNWVYSLYPYVFPKQSAEQNATLEPKPPEYIKIIRGFASGNSDEDIEKIFHSRVHNILNALNDELKNKKR